MKNEEARGEKKLSQTYFYRSGFFQWIREPPAAGALEARARPAAGCGRHGNMERASILERIGQRNAGLLVFIIVLGLGYVLSKYVKVPLLLSFTIAETGEPATFSMNLGDVLEIMAWSFVLPVAGYFLVLANVQTWKQRGLVPASKERAIAATFVMAVVLMSSGNIVHVLFNQYNGMTEDFSGVSPGAWDLFVLVYFIDEHVSHAMVHLGILLVLACVLAAEPVDGMPTELAMEKSVGKAVAGKRATVLAMVLGAVMGTVQAFSALEGQSALVSLVASWTMLVVLLAVHLARGWGAARAGAGGCFATLRLQERFNLGFFACMVVATTVAVVAWGLATGTLAFYPFFKQPGEVFP